MSSAVRRSSYMSENLQKYRRGTSTFYAKIQALYGQKYERRQSNIQFFKNGKKCQGALETFRRDITKRCALRTIAEANIRAKSQKYGRFTGNFLKMLVYTGVPISIRAGFIALLLSPIYRLFFLSFCVSIFLCLFFRLSVFLFVFLSVSLSFCLSSSWFISVHLCSWEVSLMPSEACLVHSEALAEGWSS